MSHFSMKICFLVLGHLNFGLTPNRKPKSAKIKKFIFFNIKIKFLLLKNYYKIIII